MLSVVSITVDDFVLSIGAYAVEVSDCMETVVSSDEGVAKSTRLSVVIAPSDVDTSGWLEEV